MHRGLLAPDKKDATNPTSIVQKVRLSKILETNFLKLGIVIEDISITLFGINKLYLLLLTQKMIVGMSIELCSEIMGIAQKYKTPNDKDILILISSYTDGKLYSVLDASGAMEFFPGILEDDNPVLMVIELK